MDALARRRPRWAPLAVSLTLLVGLGAFGLSLVRSSTATAEEALADGAMDKQRTVAALTDQYLQLAAKEAFDAIGDQPVALTPGDPSDEAVLHTLLAKQGGFFGHGAVLSDLDGQPLSVVGEVPPFDDPGYVPMHRSLARQQPGVSSLMWADDVPVVAIGVPVLRDGAPAAVLVAYFRADTSMLQRYSETLGSGTAGVGMVVDGSGTIVAARRPELVGTPLQTVRALQGDDTAGHAVVEREGDDLAVTWASIPTGGWTLVEEEPAAAFYASVRGQSVTAQLALLAVLVLAGVVATVLNHRTTRVRRRGAQRAEALVRDAHDVITIIDRGGTTTYASPAVTQVLGYDAADFAGRRALDLVHPDDRARVNAAVVATSGRPGDRQRLQARVARADGSYCPCELVVSDQSADRSIRGTIVSMRDVTELVALHDRLSYQALHDPVTELPNRIQLERRLTDAMAASGPDAHAGVLFLDLDGFKAVNDELGHGAGDELLVRVADRLRTCVREGDTVARFGGDEFVILVRDAHADRLATEVASRVLERLGQPFTVGGHTVEVGVSIGIALAGADQSADTVLREADAAMYLAKDHGRCRYEFPSAGLSDAGPLGRVRDTA